MTKHSKTRFIWRPRCDVKVWWYNRRRYLQL